MKKLIQVTGIAAACLIVLLSVNVFGADKMKDKNGTIFTVGSKLQPTQSKGDAGLVTCTAINNGIATMCHDQQDRCFNIDQKNLFASRWVLK